MYPHASIDSRMIHSTIFYNMNQPGIWVTQGWLFPAQNSPANINPWHLVMFRHPARSEREWPSDTNLIPCEYFWTNKNRSDSKWASSRSQKCTEKRSQIVHFQLCLLWLLQHVFRCLSDIILSWAFSGFHWILTSSQHIFHPCPSRVQPGASTSTHFFTTTSTTSGFFSAIEARDTRNMAKAKGCRSSSCRSSTWIPLGW